MTGDKKVRLGLMGCGARGVNVSRLFRDHPQCQITAFMDRFVIRAQNAAKELGLSGACIYDDFPKMLREAPMDAVFFACDPMVQADLACQAMRAGKHVCTEVPAAFTMDQCWNLVKTVEKTGVKYQMLEQVRFAGFIDVWKQMRERGELGHVCLAQGEYVHYLPCFRNWYDVKTGEQFHELVPPPGREVAESWHSIDKRDPIFYLPHTLSPILKVLDDRVVRVSCMGTGPGSHVLDRTPSAWRDIEYALMHTAKDTVILAGAGFSLPNVHRGPIECHWWELRGTKGAVSSPRHKTDGFRCWKEGMSVYQETDLGLAPLDADELQARSGHGGMDYKPVDTFIRSIVEDGPTGMDVYQAVETAAPAILAAESARSGGILLDVPDFRPAARNA
jgi:predicted dehydrogenase